MEIDTAALFEYSDAIARSGVNGVVLFGSTGEFIHFAPEERIRATGLAIKRSRLPVLVNASHSSLPGAVAIAEAAIESGAAGLLLMPPFFYTYSEDQIFEFYSQFVRSIGTGTRIYLYNLPMFTNPISSQLARRLLETGSFAGIKDSSGALDLWENLRILKQELPFQLMAGNEAIYLIARRLGADGIISGIGAALPELMVALDLAICSSDLDMAELLNARLMEFLGHVHRFPPTVAIRQAAATRGWRLGDMAVPLDSQRQADAREFVNWFRSWSTETLAECNSSGVVRT